MTFVVQEWHRFTMYLKKNLNTDVNLLSIDWEERKTGIAAEINK